MDQSFIYVGYIASAVTASQILPQVLETFRKKTVEGLSFLFILLLLVNSLLWITYGVGFLFIDEKSNAFIVIVPSIISVLCSLAEILAFKLYGKKKNDLLLENKD